MPVEMVLTIISKVRPGLVQTLAQVIADHSQTFRHLHACSGCFRLERSPSRTCTHWKAPPFHGAHPERTSPTGLGNL